MRIVSGTFKGRRLEVPKNLKARPTTDFAKENLFNILNNYIEWEESKCLDLFAGTGSISLELISRDSPSVTCVEKHPQHAIYIEKNKSTLEITNLRIIKNDVFKYIELCKEGFDFIFADPPYDLPVLEKIPNLILEKNILNKNGIFVMEHSKNNNFDSLQYFVEKRVYGSVNFSIFRK